MEVSPLLAIQAQQVASKARDKEKNESVSGRRFNDLVELRVGNVETADAVHRLPQNDSEEAQSEHQGQQSGDSPASPQDQNSTPHIDLRA